jgi:hypothetical protein
MVTNHHLRELLDLRTLCVLLGQLTQLDFRAVISKEAACIELINFLTLATGATTLGGAVIGRVALT